METQGLQKPQDRIEIPKILLENPRSGNTVSQADKSEVDSHWTKCDQ